MREGQRGAWVYGGGEGRGARQSGGFLSLKNSSRETEPSPSVSSATISRSAVHAVSATVSTIGNVPVSSIITSSSCQET